MSDAAARTSMPSAYVTPVVKVGDLVFVSGQLPREDGEILVRGVVDVDCSVSEARAAAAVSARACLALVTEAAGGRDFVVAKITGFVASAPGAAHMGAVVDGASEEIVAQLGSGGGAHARSAVGVSALPHDASVEVEMIAVLQPAP